ncbi:alpha/beta fold hydrolase [Reinekea blandensis]|uniref:AB hydrolase-1 domain-containing protein n=1 Tax=Reinekea blandensis MED297 TaxID=314283 RepID=A4B9M1_9GAMM|nr:alpha/beta fold hydrolase [Reinekea blandensis]EAR11322.1 hypothetical protein MED297_20582 [Reinekea sp. MED297] [Reinekea blandensis MED297]
MYTVKDRSFLLKNHLKSVLGATTLQSMEVRGRTWRWLSAGDTRAREAVVLLHGLAMSKNHWRSVLSSLGKDHYVIAPDIPGLRLDQPVATPQSGFSGIARELCDFFSVAVGRPVHLVGHSMAAALSLGLAMRMTVPVQSITLVSLADSCFTEKLSHTLNFERMSDFIQNMTEDQHLTYVREMFHQPPIGLPLMARSNWTSFNRHRERCVNLLHAMEAELSYVEAYGQSLDIPMLIIGGREDPWYDLTRHSNFYDRPRVTRVEMEGCKHLPFIERPREFAAALHNFVGKAQQWRPGA